jgi:hypothetical protein
MLYILCSPLCSMNRGREHWRADCWRRLKPIYLHSLNYFTEPSFCSGQKSGVDRNGLRCNRSSSVPNQNRHHYGKIALATSGLRDVIAFYRIQFEHNPVQLIRELHTCEFSGVGRWLWHQTEQVCFSPFQSKFTTSNAVLQTRLMTL